MWELLNKHIQYIATCIIRLSLYFCALQAASQIKFAVFSRAEFS